MADEGDHGTWLWRSLVGLSLSALGFLTLKGCELRDDVRDRLNGLERDWRYMHEIDSKQSERIDDLERFVRERAGLLLDELQNIDHRLDTILPDNRSVPAPPRPREKLER